MSDWLATTRRHESTAGNTFAEGAPVVDAVRGEGPWLVAQDGRRWLDLTSGSATTALGHGNAAQAAAITSAVAEGILHTGTRLGSRHRAALYERLAALAPPGLSAVHLLNSGSEAVEAALKASEFATGRHGFVAFQGGYHGRTLGALSVTASRRLRAPFLPPARPVAFMPYPYAERPPLPGSTAESIAEDCVAVLRHALECPVSGLDLPAAVIVEAVQGVSGVVTPAPAFLLGLRELCNRHGIVLVADEVWTGFGRTGNWFAFEQAGITPDLIVVGKALSASLPLSGVIGRPELLQRWPAGLHTSTFQGNPVACAAAVATLDEIVRRNLLTHVRGTLEPAMAAWAGDLRGLPGVGPTRVAGALAAVECVDAAGAPDAARAAAAVSAALLRKVLVYRGGWYGNAVMLIPPLDITVEDLGVGLAAIQLALMESANGGLVAS